MLTSRFSRLVLPDCDDDLIEDTELRGWMPTGGDIGSLLGCAEASSVGERRIE